MDSAEASNMEGLRPVEWTPDASQQAVIDVSGGYNLVLAPPGCGKTQILTERVLKAHERGVSFADMLCLTFTNRAARGMQERITGRVAADGLENLYVGNIHRFCSKFLYDNNIIEAGTSVIDDDDALSILARYLDEDEDEVRRSYQRRSAYHEIIQFSHLMHQVERHYPRSLRLHPECMTANDVDALRRMCSIWCKELNADTLTDTYEHNGEYADELRTGNFDSSTRQLLQPLLHKMRYAHAFTAYCRQNHLIDFEDLLLLTYDALSSGKGYRRYPWIQVDEVQDLNSLQLAIVDLISTLSPSAPQDADGEILYLGDEQQAIFSFMGAKMDTLELLKGRCHGHIHHLSVNHRSPRYLLEVFNTYAHDELGISEELLPSTGADSGSAEGALRIISSDTLESEYADVADFAGRLYSEHGHDTTAIIVSSNNDADAISQQLSALRLPHFKVSGQDVFASQEVKLLLAHFNVIANDNNFICWSRILKGLGVFQTAAAARAFMRNLFVRAMSPADFLMFDDGTYVQHFCDDCEHRELVVFDTETTGLSVFDDDILQIAAVKVRDGRRVDDSEFCVYIDSDRPIPPMLGQKVNPIVEERRRHELLKPDVALRKFMDYVGDDILVGHNVEFDYHILDFNLRRRAAISDFRSRHPLYYDTLRLLRLLVPDLHSYRLDSFRERDLFGIKADDAHLADVDVEDTLKVLTHCYMKGREMEAAQSEFINRPATQQRISTLRQNYMDIYFHTRNLLYERGFAQHEPVLVSEMRSVYQALIDSSRMMPIDKLSYIFEYLSHDILRPSAEPSLLEQLQKHVMEINTLKEADLCNSSTINDRIFVTTVHKAKGLEFDNVIVFDAVDGRYPNYYSQNNPRQVAEDKRKFYVAISRARKRLYISRSLTRIDFRGNIHERHLTPFMREISRFFTA